ncbi:LAME_0G18272g1_1 [Lachancea meyersii CBS 8951]|uniref:LAME_0G18272g1_1 n=1 Tax=Lachancea meyersii CBS 8951 TaxID=1266667 RepID=A0A1G4KBQ0_9SACH|nr:LAME_0G18272g1_1 [Lachancea meyersii CBS 8951]
MLRSRSSDRPPAVPARRLSSNNPFRTDSVVQQQQTYQSDEEFQKWVSSNAIHSPYKTSANAGSGSGSGAGQFYHKSSSLLSFTDSIEEEPSESLPRVSSPRSGSDMRSSMTPPQRPASKNPFLEDLSPQSATDDASTASSTYPTAQEEKDRLRRRYLEHTPIDDHSLPAEDLPPAYDEVAGPKKDAARPREKSASSRSHRHRSHQHASRDRSEREKSGSSRSSGTHQPSSSSQRKSSRDKKHSSSSSSSKPLAKNVDTIDKLDVTGLFGGAFHHDGPFDACTPHRNRNQKVAPVMAFPANGPNSSIAGAANSKSPMKEVFGQESVDDDDTYLYASRPYHQVNNASSTATVDAIKPNSRKITQFDTKAQTQLVHGPTTDGLGSTTFLDGAPAKGAQNSYNRLHPLSADTRKQERLQLTKTHSGHLEYDNVDPDEDVYVGGRIDPAAKKSASGNKFMRRVKSLKVGRKP